MSQPEAAEDDARPSSAALVGALYQLAADPDDWAAFIAQLGAEPSPDDPPPEALAAMVEGAEQVALHAASARGTDSSDRYAVAAARRGGAIAMNPEARRGALGSLLLGDTGAEALRSAEARVRGSNGRPTLVRLDAVSDGATVFAYAMALSQLPARLATDLEPSPQAWGEAIALVAPVGAAAPDVERDLASAFGLSPAEVRLATGLASGASLAELAARWGLSVNTLRNQLNAIFSKVGVSRQTDLVRALSDLARLWPQVRGEPDRPLQASAIAPAVEQLRLQDGRRLAYRVYGAPDGRPVLALHGGLGASLLPPGTDDRCRALGLRLVAPERAGIGRSDPRSDHAPAWPDMLALVEALRLTPLQLVSLASGSTHALELAAARPDLVSRVLLLSPRPPVLADSPSPMVKLQRRIKTHPWLANALFRLMRTRLSRPLVRQIMQASAVSPGDAAFLAERPETVDLITLAMQEALRERASGSARESARMMTADDVAALGRLPPVVAWLGAEDPYATPDAVTDWLGQSLAQLSVTPGVGQYLALKHWPEALAWLAGDNQLA